ncbi:MAG: CDP-alcohol phosphatidyltransferase family protein [Lachnospiraceae bacterium]|nr:CDP-alcohol phosphatidyltransferase family protein [Lachnospiraceae bacterium]
MLKPFSVIFDVLYIYCGISDMVDGFIARKTHTESKIGEILDSIADLMFVVICLSKILPVLHISTWLWIWIFLIAIIKCINLIWGYVCQHKIVFLHTKANKVTGFLLFLLPLFIPFHIFSYVSIGVASVKNKSEDLIFHTAICL